MEKVIIIAHLNKENVLEHTIKLADYLAKRKIKVVMPACDMHHFKNGKNISFQDVLEGDLVIVLGGDGTILRAIRIIHDKQTPILGVNFGKVGFLAAIELEDLYRCLPHVLQKEYQAEKRQLIEVRTFGDNAKGVKFLALNEVVIERKYFGKLIELDVSINGRFFNRYSADGLIVASPTGSTAYSFSAGGPIVSPETKTILLSPICTHSLFNRSIILSDKENVTITCPSSEKSGVIISVDGREVVDVQNFQKMEIKMSKVFAHLIKVNERSFYDILREKIRVWDFTIS